MLYLLFLVFAVWQTGVSSFHTASHRSQFYCRQVENTKHQPRFSPILSSPIADTVDAISTQNTKIRYPNFLKRHASDTSFGITGALSSRATNLRGDLVDFMDRYPWLDSTAAQINSAFTFVAEFCVKSWWILPMVLALVPIYSALIKGTCASMPHWWQMTNMDYIRRSEQAALVIGGFLLSNIAYFVSGSFLVNRFPFRPSRKGLVPIRPTRFTMLGVWILIAGAVSTIFHSVQALGSYAVAESLCYVDHGVAISASFYYLHTCGFPSRKVLKIGIAGLLSLIMTYPSYAILHSAWHFLSAAAATKWALEGFEHRQ